ncbi:MAG: hypothetical protein NVS4B12_08770 [Ktedonobacteraceae bacterium]
MNPYDFARIDWNWSPERRKPVWHHRLFSHEGQQLYSGHLDVDIYVEMPLFIMNPRTVSDDPKKPASCLQNALGEYIIPSSSLKGMLRCLVETLGNGCMTIFDGDYERRTVDYNRELSLPFQRCDNNTDLCIACRTFGMLNGRDNRGGAFLGKVNIGDAVAYLDTLQFHDPIYTKPLTDPKPHHESFYLNESKKHIAGRKYYFHHAAHKPLEVATRFFYNKSGRPSNRYIQPLDYGTVLHFRADFTCLERDEFAAFLFAVALEDTMRHSLGYGKPLGLGAAALMPRSITLVDYRARYTQAGAAKGKTVIEGDDLWHFIYEQSDVFGEMKLASIALDDLRRIWLWPPDAEVDYYYPSKRDWFDTKESVGKRIADTKYVPG